MVPVNLHEISVCEQPRTPPSTVCSAFDVSCLWIVQVAYIVVRTTANDGIIVYWVTGRGCTGDEQGQEREVCGCGTGVGVIYQHEFVVCSGGVWWLLCCFQGARVHMNWYRWVHC